MVKVITENNSNEFANKLNDFLDNGYEVSSSNCEYDGENEYYVAVLYKSESNKCDSKMHICYMTDIPDRMENAKEFFSIKYCAEILKSTDTYFETATGIFHFVDCNNRKNYEGLRVEQAIVDYRSPMIEIARQLTAHSLLPKGMRIIDDREYGLRDTRRKND